MMSVFRLSLVFALGSVLSGCVTQEWVTYHVRSAPPGCGIEANGQQLGTTPCDIRLAYSSRWAGLANAPGGWAKGQETYEVYCYPPPQMAGAYLAQSKRITPAMTEGREADLIFQLQPVAQNPGALRPVPSTPAPSARPEAPGAITVSGTGFLVGNDLVLTANHVVEDSPTITVYCAGVEYSAKPIGCDSVNDLCLLRLDRGTGIPPLVFSAPGSVQHGQRVYLMGYPLQFVLESTAPVIGEGLVSSLQGLHGDLSTMQITAPANPGNSGGPVLDSSGHVAGILLSRYSDIHSLQTNHTVPQGVNFALKADFARVLLASLGAELGTAADLDVPLQADAIHRMRSQAVVPVIARKVE